MVGMDSLPFAVTWAAPFLSSATAARVIWPGDERACREGRGGEGHLSEGHLSEGVGIVWFWFLGVHGGAELGLSVPGSADAHGWLTGRQGPAGGEWLISSENAHDDICHNGERARRSVFRR